MKLLVSTKKSMRLGCNTYTDYILTTSSQKAKTSPCQSSSCKLSSITTPSIWHQTKLITSPSHLARRKLNLPIKLSFFKNLKPTLNEVSDLMRTLSRTSDSSGNHVKLKPEATALRVLATPSLSTSECGLKQCRTRFQCSTKLLLTSWMISNPPIGWTTCLIPIWTTLRRLTSLTTAWSQTLMASCKDGHKNTQKSLKNSKPSRMWTQSLGEIKTQSTLIFGRTPSLSSFNQKIGIQR